MSVRRGTAVTVPQLEARSESSTEALTIGPGYYRKTT